MTTMSLRSFTICIMATDRATLISNSYNKSFKRGRIKTKIYWKSIYCLLFMGVTGKAHYLNTTIALVTFQNTKPKRSMRTHSLLYFSLYLSSLSLSEVLYSSFLSLYETLHLAAIKARCSEDR